MHEYRAALRQNHLLAEQRGSDKPDERRAETMADATAQAIGQLEGANGQLYQIELKTEDAGVLQNQIDRYLAGGAVELDRPFRIQ